MKTLTNIENKSERCVIYGDVDQTNLLLNIFAGNIMLSMRNNQIMQTKNTCIPLVDLYWLSKNSMKNNFEIRIFYRATLYYSI